MIFMVIPENQLQLGYFYILVPFIFIGRSSGSWQWPGYFYILVPWGLRVISFGFLTALYLKLAFKDPLY